MGSNYLNTAYPDMLKPRIDPALTKPYKSIESAKKFMAIFKLLGNESRTYRDYGNATDTKARTVFRYQITASSTTGANTATVLTIAAGSLGPNPSSPASPVMAASTYTPTARHILQVGHKVVINNGGTPLWGTVTAVPAANQVTVIGSATGSDFGLAVNNAIAAGGAYIYPGDTAFKEAATGMVWGWTVGTTREEFELQNISFGFEMSGTLLDSGALTWYDSNLNEISDASRALESGSVSAGELYWANEFVDDNFNTYERMIGYAHTMSDPNQQNSSNNGFFMTGLWWATDTNGYTHSIGGTGWSSLSLEDFDDFFMHYKDLNLSVKQWMGITDTQSSLTANRQLMNWGLGNHLFELGSLNQDMVVAFNFASYNAPGTDYKLSWMSWEEMDNQQSPLSIYQGSMYMMPVGGVATSVGQRPYTEMLYLGRPGYGSSVGTFSNDTGRTRNGQVSTVERDSDQWAFNCRRGNMLRLQAALGKIVG